MMRRTSMLRQLAIACLVGAAAVTTAVAQLRVDLSFQRSMFIRFEPMLAVVTITNLSGEEIELADEGNYKWFSFRVQTTTGRLVPPYNPDYELSPMQIGPGQSAKRLVNLTPLYPMTEFGVYRVAATVYARQMGEYFSSNPPLNVEVTEGRTLWEQTVGVPGQDGLRKIQLLSHRLPKYTQLYLRVQDEDAGIVYCTHQLGRYVPMGLPIVELDAANEIHILQPTSPKEFLYTHVDLQGAVLARKQYQALRERPTLRKDTNGGVQVVGGFYVDPEAKAAEAAAPPPPGVGDRPVPVPE